MPSRGYLIPAVVLWLVSTSWLVTTKVVPTLTAGNPPDYGQLLPSRAKTLEPVKWTIRWNGRDIGWAENRISRSIDGTGKMVSEVQFQQLPVSELITDLLGAVGTLARPMLSSGFESIDLHVLTNFNFDSYGTLDDFDTRVDLAQVPQALYIEGRVEGEQLDLAARIQPHAGAQRKVFHKTIHLPPDALVADSFSPRPRLANLRVGQTWTFQSYRPLLPHNPLELIEATVDREELIDWNGRLVETKVVAYRRDAGSGLSSARMPISMCWVMDDGTVLRQDVSMANVRVQFIRLTSLDGWARDDLADHQELAQN